MAEEKNTRLTCARPSTQPEHLQALQLQETPHNEWKNQLYMAFIDEEKTFDRVVRAELWKCLEERGVLGEL